MNVEIKEVLAALEDDRVVPYFQPIADLRTGELQGFEVLARYDHPELGYILPENFIPLIEAHGLIGMLTHQVFSKAFQLAPLLPSPITLSPEHFAPADAACHASQAEFLSLRKKAVSRCSR